MATPVAPSGNSEQRLKVFVSYAHEDRDRTRQLVHALEQAGLEVWWDGLIVAGTQFAHETERALLAANAVVVVWSTHSVASHWVRDEAAVGRDRSRLVPVSLDGTEPPLGFRQYLFIDLSKWQGKPGATEISALLGAIRSSEDARAGTPAAAPPPSAPKTSRRRLLIAGGGLAVAALGGVGGYVALSRRSGSAATGNGVAVLPFKNLSGDASQAYFADGLSAELRGTLSRNPHLHVTAQVSSEAFRGTEANATSIAKTLGVSYLLDGNVRRSGSTFRIAAELIDGETGFSRWSRSFDRPIDNIFAVQSEIAASVAQALQAEMQHANSPVSGQNPPHLSGGTTNVEAFDAYLRGRAMYISGSGEADDRAALADFDAAIAADPNFAAAHAARARSLLVIANQYADAAHTGELYDAAVASARTAVSLAPDLADAQSTLAYVLFQGRLDVRGAREPFEQSRLHGEGDAAVMGRFALYCIYNHREAEAIPAMQTALRLDPLNPLVQAAMCEALYQARRYSEAMPYSNRALELNPKLSNAHARQALVLLMLGRPADARIACVAEGHDMTRLAALAVIEHRLGNEAASRAAMGELESRLGDTALYQQAQVRAQWGETDRSIELLQRARATGDSGLIYANTDPLLDPLRKRPAFAQLLSDLGFV
jgi:TolB-like protein/tetratricopeptide (TPR) repeat protein